MKDEDFKGLLKSIDQMRKMHKCICEVCRLNNPADCIVPFLKKRYKSVREMIKDISSKEFLKIFKKILEKKKRRKK